MYTRCSFLFAVLTISWLARASCRSNASNNLLLDQLTKSCPRDGIPVCGIRDKQLVLFSNGCLLNEANKDILQSDKIVSEVPLQYCMTGCQFSCPTTNEPVCGRNVKTSERQLFKNQCELMKHACKTNMDWRIVNYGICPEDYSKDRRRKENPSMRHLVKKRSYRNNLYNQIEYNANDFVDYKNKHNILTNDLYVYMPPEIQTQYLNHEASSYQQAIPQHKTYDEIFNKIASFSPADMSFSVEEHKRDIGSPISAPSNNNPPSYAINRMGLNYLTDQNLANGLKVQKVSPSVETFTGEDKKPYYYAFAKIGNEDIEIPKNSPIATISRNTSNGDNQADVKGKSVECKYGSVAICAALADGTLRTFDTICEMMTANVYFKSTWTKLHDGACENCKNNCSRDYQPVCVSRNGVNYTMVNDCYYNMAICMDKISKWQKISNKECERYTRIPDKYVNSKPGFHYTSNYFISETTAMPRTDSALLAVTTTPKTLRENSNEIKEHRPNFKRAISAHICCPESNNSDDVTREHRKCECSTETTQTPLAKETHIMSLVKERR